MYGLVLKGFLTKDQMRTARLLGVLLFTRITMPQLFVPTALVVSWIFKIKPSHIPAWLVAALVMDEDDHFVIEPLLQDSFGRWDVTVPIEEASRGFRMDLKKILVDPGRVTAVWRLFDHDIADAIPTSYEYKEIWNAAFSPEPQPIQPPPAPQPDEFVCPSALEWTTSQRATAIVSPLATPEQIAMICGKFGTAPELPRETPKAKPPAPRKKARAIPADPKLAAPDYGACKTAKPKQPKKPAATEEVSQGQKKKWRAA